MEKKEEKKKLIGDNTKEPDFYVKVVLSSFEAALIRKLRKFEWGTFVVLKQNRQPRKCDVQESDFLHESDGMALEIESKELEDTLQRQGKKIIDETSGG